MNRAMHIIAAQPFLTLGVNQIGKMNERNLRSDITGAVMINMANSVAV
jgi:hypothetical protein